MKLNAKVYLNSPTACSKTWKLDQSYFSQRAIFAIIRAIFQRQKPQYWQTYPVSINIVITRRKYD
jgi:hypothetical protein